MLAADGGCSCIAGMRLVHADLRAWALKELHEVIAPLDGKGRPETVGGRREKERGDGRVGGQRHHFGSESQSLSLVLQSASLSPSTESHTYT